MECIISLPGAAGIVSLYGCRSYSSEGINRSAYGYIGNKHGTGMTIEQGPQSGKNGFDFFFRHDGKHHDLAACIVKHQMSLMKPVVAFAGNVADHRVSGSFDFVQQITDEFQVFALNNNFNFFHGMKFETVHGLCAPFSSRMLKKAPSGVLPPWPCSRTFLYAPPVQAAAALLNVPF